MRPSLRYERRRAAGQRPNEGWSSHQRAWRSSRSGGYLIGSVRTVREYFGDHAIAAQLAVEREHPPVPRYDDIPNVCMRGRRP